MVISKPLIRKYGAYPVTALSISIATLPMVSLFVSMETFETLRTMTARNWFDMTYMAALSTFLATITWNYGASRLSAATTGATLYLVPVIAVISGAIMLDEAITPDILTGGALIIAGVAIAQIGPRMQRTQLDPNA